jgi:PEGA domain
VDRSQHTYTALDELKQIQAEARRSISAEHLRRCFERVQAIRRAYVDDFDLQLFIAELQEEIIERARGKREQAASALMEDEPGARRPKPRESDEHSSEAAEIPPDVQPVDAKTWQRATYIGLFFAILLFATFIYLVQAARKLNFPPAANPPQTAQQQPAATPKAPLETASTAPAAPTLRLYTDLEPGAVTIDDGEPRDLKDGELVLDDLEPGQHSIKVEGRSGNAAFTFDVAEKSAPRIVSIPSASNAMAVLVSTEGGKAHLVTNADNSDVSLDGKPAGQVGPDGLNIENLGQSDHELQVTQGKDRQRFVLTYTPAPALTVYVKSDPNAGTVVVNAGQDGADVYIDDALYRRKTDRGQVRIPLKVGDYTIRVHKTGFIDPPPKSVTVKKAEETAVNFHLDPVPQIATLAIKGALQGTMVYVDNELAAVIGPDGAANISNVKPGDHSIELRREQALPKKFQRSFRTGDVVTLSGPDVTLDKAITENKPPPPVNPPEPAQQNYSMEMEGSQVRKGGGFVAYHIPRVAGHYSFAAQGHIGGFLKHSKLQWYAGYQDDRNYVLFALDGKHATVHEVRDGKSVEVARVPFNAESNEWVQVDLSVRPDSIGARVRTPEAGWSDLGAVPSPGRDYTQDKVGFYIPGGDEIAVSNFRFSNH